MVWHCIAKLYITVQPSYIHILKKDNMLPEFLFKWCLKIVPVHQHKQGKSEGFDSCDRPSNPTQIGFKSSIFQPVSPWNLMDDPDKTIGHLFYATLSFLHHFFIAIGEFETVRKCLIWIKIDNFFSRVTLQFDRWPRKTIGHLFHATSSYVHHSLHIGKFKLELQSGNA